MKKFLKEEYPWFLTNAIWYWLFPYAALAMMPEESHTTILLGLVMIINPLFSLISALIYGMRRGRKWIYLVYTAIAFLGAMLLFFNTSAWMYGVITIACAAVGIIAGGWTRGKHASEEEKWARRDETEALRKKVAASNSAPRTASKTAQKNQQKAYVRKAKERAAKEEKRRNKNSPKSKKKKGGH